VQRGLAKAPPSAPCGERGSARLPPTSIIRAAERTRPETPPFPRDGDTHRRAHSCLLPG
jgi:hypothetical protein